MYSPVRGTNSTHVQKPQIFIKVLPNKNTFEHCTHTIHTYIHAKYISTRQLCICVFSYVTDGETSSEHNHKNEY